MRKRCSWLCACAATAAGLLVPALPADEAELDLSDLMKLAAPGAATAAASQGKPFPPFEEVTKDMKSTAGFFTLWAYPPEKSEKDQERLLAQIPARLLGEQFMLSTSVSGGGMFTGFPLDQRVVKWEVLGKQLLLIEPETRFVTESSKDVSDAVRRTYPERIRIAVPILTKTAGGDVLIDLGALLKSNFADIGWMVNPVSFLGFGSASASINQQLSTFTKKKAFELNVEIGVDLAVAENAPPGSHRKVMVHYSFWGLPRTDYQPRVADDRVGYFLTANSDWSKSVESRELFNRYIDRWHLQKRDPSLALSEPKAPITYYIEKTVPVRFRRAVRDGILEWNKAYEKIGFVNAIEVRQQTDDNEYKDLDPEDMRYSFFRWIVTGQGFAMGPHRANPFTGQIYDADIVMDDSMVRFFQQDYDTQLVPSAIAAMKFGNPAAQMFLGRFPEYQRLTRDWERVSLGRNPMEAPLLAAAARRLWQQGHCNCNYSELMKQQLAFGHAMLCDQPEEKLDQFLYDVIKEVVMHEVGHTLGLRHNFKASSIYTVAEIEQRRSTDQPTTGSVMDYNPALFFGKDAAKGHFLTPTIGPYDYWAIEYGYRPYEPGKSPATAAKTADDEAKPDAKLADADSRGNAGTNGQAHSSAEERVFAVNEIPVEVRAKLPPEVLKILEAAGTATAGAPSAGAGAKASTPALPMPPAGESEMLLQIAARSSEPELAYATDEDTWMGPDPRCNLFDCGADPVDWARTRMELVDRRMSNILEWAVKDKESWHYLRQAYSRLMFERATTIDFVGRFIGGQYFNRSHKGDAGAKPPFTHVEAQRQRAALKFLEDTIFSDSFFAISSDVLNHLAPARWWHDGTSVDLVMDYPVHEYVAMLQWFNLVDRLSATTLRRIHDAEMKVSEDDRFTVAEYLQGMNRACWGDALDGQRMKKGEWTDGKPFISDIRRSLQREYLGLVEPLVRRSPGTLLSPDLQAMVRYSLEEMATQMGTILSTSEPKLDFASRAHLSSCKQRIERMLSPELREIEWSPFSMMVGQPAGQRPEAATAVPAAQMLPH